MFNTELFGYIAAVCTTAAYFPQAFKVHKSNQTRDISFGMFSLMTFGIASWLAYGFALSNMPMILANSVSLVLACYILFKKISEKFKKNVKN